MHKSNYRGTTTFRGLGKDVLDPEAKREAFMTAIGIPQSDESIMNEALNNADNSHFKGIVDPGMQGD